MLVFVSDVIMNGRQSIINMPTSAPNVSQLFGTNQGRNNLAEIPLSQGKIAIVDDEDFDFLNKWKWSCDAMGYAVKSAALSSGNGKRCILLMHRLILLPHKGQMIDHINRNPLDNRRSNLRLCDKRTNSYNRGPTVKNLSGLKGVYWDAKYKKWRAQIKINGKQTYLGGFTSDTEAARAYNEAALKHFGEFAWLNAIL